MHTAPRSGYSDTGGGGGAVTAVRSLSTVPRAGRHGYIETRSLTTGSVMNGYRINYGQAEKCTKPFRNRI